MTVPQQQPLIGPAMPGRTTANPALALQTRPEDRFKDRQMQAPVSPFERFPEKLTAAEGDVALAAHERDRVKKTKPTEPDQWRRGPGKQHKTQETNAPIVRRRTAASHRRCAALTLARIL